MTEKETYRNFTIKIHTDDSPENPFEEWDGNLPLMYHNDSWNNKDYSQGAIERTIQESVSDGQIILHQKIYAPILDLEIDDMIDYDREEKIDMFRETITDLINQAKYDNIEAFCNEIGLPCLSTSRTGYYQGDYANIFICWTPEYTEVNGNKKEDIKPEWMEDAADLWAAWAYDDVYGYSIEDLDDSCFGFYGTDHDKSGLMEYAKNAIDCHIENSKKTIFNKVKELIKAKVPIFYRKRIIENLKSELHYEILS